MWNTKPRLIPMVTGALKSSIYLQNINSAFVVRAMTRKSDSKQQTANTGSHLEDCSGHPSLMTLGRWQKYTGTRSCCKSL